MLNSLTRQGVIPAHQASDEELWREDLSWGDEAALAEVYDRYAAQLYGLCLRILRDPQRAEAALSKALVLAWETGESAAAQLGNFTLSAWLINLTRSVCVEELRQERPPDSSRAKTRPDARSTLPKTKRAARIRRAMAELSLEEWLVVELAYFCGFTCAEIARHLGWQESAVVTCARSALRNLRQHLAAQSIWSDE